MRTQSTTAARRARRSGRWRQGHMIALRSSQPQFAEGFIEEAVGDLWEPWMRQADRVLEDDQLLNFVYEALLRRHPKSRTRGRLVCLPRLSSACCCSNISGTGVSM